MVVKNRKPCEQRKKEEAQRSNNTTPAAAVAVCREVVELGMNCIKRYGCQIARVVSKIQNENPNTAEKLQEALLVVAVLVVEYEKRYGCQIGWCQRYRTRTLAPNINTAFAHNFRK